MLLLLLMIWLDLFCSCCMGFVLPHTPTPSSKQSTRVVGLGWVLDTL